MHRLAALISNTCTTIFKFIPEALRPSPKPEGHRRFLMESLESRVLLSAEPVVLPDWFEIDESGAESIVVVTDNEDSGDNAVDGQPDGGEEEEEEGGDFIEHEAYDELYGDFDYDLFLTLEIDGLMGGQGGAVEEAPDAADVRTNNNNGATGTAGFTQSETSVIAFGNTVLVAFNDSGSTSGGTNKFTGFARSTDGGLTFSDGGVLPTNSTGDGGDPVLARNNSNGRIFLATLQTSTTPVNGIAVFHSDDDGLTWSAPVQGAPGKPTTGLQDKEWIAVDNFAGAGNGNVYLAERDFGPGNGIYFFRSTDNGNSFGPSGGTLIVSAAAAPVQGAFVAVGLDHSVYVFWQTTNSIQVRKSTDQGLTFGAPVTVATFLAAGGSGGDLGLTGIRQGTATAGTFRSNKFPHVVVNPVNGNIYVTYNDDGAGVDRADVYVVQSTTGGTTWGAPIKVNDDTTTTDQWQPTLAVTPTGDKLGIFYSSRQEDSANNLFKYYGRIANISGATLTFTPGFAVSDTASLPEFGRDGVVNPVYMGDYNTAYSTPGFFQVSWSDNRDDLAGGTGQKNPNVYFKAIDLGLTVRATSPAIGSVVSTIPVDYVVNLSDAIQAATVQASDFTVDGVAANSVILNTPTQVTFHFNSAPFANQGLHVMAMAAGAILRTSDGDELAEFSGNFRYDAVQLQVTSTVPPVSGAFILPGPFTYDVNFNEAISPASVQTADLVVSGIAGALVTGATVLTGNTTVRFTLSGITTQGQLSVNIMGGAITDAFGNPGPGIPFSRPYSVDIVTAAFPTPLIGRSPQGSLIYESSATGFITPAGDTDSFTLSIDPGQTITVKVSPTSPSLQPSVQLVDPSGTLIGSSAAGGANQNALLQTVVAAAGGTYQIDVGDAGGSTGGYSVQVILNAALENEGNILGSTNNTPTSNEQTINAIDTGVYFTPGSHSPSDNGYQVGALFAGTSFVTEFRNYATFSLPSATPTILSAELRMVSGSYSSPDPTETYTLFDVTATPAVLDANHNGDLPGITIYGDLASGTIYGTRIVSSADNNTTLLITLNAAAVAALNAAIGSTISLGGSLTTLAGTVASQLMFAGTGGGQGNIQLVVHTASPVTTAQNIDSSFITLSTPQASAERGAVLGQTDASGYSAAAVPFTFEDISTTGTLITPLTNQDNTSASIPFTFTFPFYGVNNVVVIVSSNGLLNFLSPNVSPANADLTTAPTQATIAPFWDDLHTGGGVAGSNVYFQTIGSGANQHLTVQWNNVRFLSGGAAGDTVTFEAQMFADGRIQFNYMDLNSGAAAGNNGASATVGIKAVGTQGPDRLLLAFNNGPNTFVGTGKSTLITPLPVPDYYAFTLHNGEKATLAATAQTSDSLNLEIRDSSDAVLAIGISAGNLTSVISNFSVLTGGTYYARISAGASVVPYSLVITKDAVFDTEANSTADTAQTLDGTQGVLGAILGGATINAIDSGWIFGDGSHGATNGNYVAGQGLIPTLAEFHNYVTFALSTATSAIVGAELRLFNPTIGYNSPDPTETFTLFDVSTTPAALDTTRVAGDATGIAIHADLGSGTVFGSRVVSAADNNTTVTIVLNAAAVAALNAAIGSTISFGGALTTLSGTATQFIFGGTSGAPGQVQLVLQTVADDWYSIALPSTANALRLETSTPGDGPGEPVNTLNPKIELYDSTGLTLLASGVVRPDGRNESLVVDGLTPGATYKARVTSEGGSTGEYFLSRNFNFSPVVTLVAAPPINENDSATLNVAFSDVDASDTHTVIITWGTGEGSTTLNLAAGVLTFSATHQYLNDNPLGTPSDIYAIGVTVTDNHFGSGAGSVDLTVNNVAPDVAPINGPDSGVRGQALNFSGSFTDVGSLDTHAVRWDFGDGTLIDFHPSTDPDALNAPIHVYTESGDFALTLSVRDSDGGLTTIVKNLAISGVAVQEDPVDSTKTALVVGGTSGDDIIVFNPQGNDGEINVWINGILQGVFHPTGHIIAFGQAGDDDIEVAGSIALDTWLYGDSGNDRLKGGAGGGILMGGDGNDNLNGGRGRSILIGGFGMDRLVGGSGDDILIGGITTFNGNSMVLGTLLERWTSTVDSYAVRVVKLRMLLNDITVTDDGDADKLTGSSGLDWFFLDTGDVVTDNKSSEIVE